MSNVNQDLELLRDDLEYYHGVGRKYLSNSDINILIKDPRKYGIPRPDDLNLAMGRYIHTSLLEPHKVGDVLTIDVSTRNTKVYKDFLKKENLNFVMLKSEKEKCDSVIKAITTNIEFFDMIYDDGNKYEEPGIKELYGHKFKGKADIITDSHIIDVKTTSDINKFRSSAYAYGYNSQCYLYQEIFDKPMKFLVVDKLTLQLGIFTPTAAFVDSGKERVIRGVEIYDKYFGPKASSDVNDHYIEEYL